ncbi:enoyl-CoA hydratase/isomerase family protein [Ramlibacter sp.]|uniref:enoyl-CoA hydratase/isomerase family protein n=1 Tax=Ramlibacter sp. TaxID=1917967 RepID=UPI003D0A7B8F
MNESVIYEVADGVAHIRLNQAEKRNPLDETATRELTQCLLKAQADPKVHVMLLTAAGSAFSAGGDLREFQQKLTQPSLQVYDEGKSSAELFKVLGVLNKPLIGAVNGAAFGGGCGLACACHIVVASDKAKFGCTEVKLGLFPMVILPMVRRVVGDRMAMHMSVTATVLSAEEAQRAGIVSRMVAHDRLEDEAKALAKQIASYSPVALRVGLEGFAQTTDMEYGKAVDYLNTLRVVAFQTEDLQEGASAFLARREPAWKGR